MLKEDISVSRGY